MEIQYKNLIMSFFFFMCSSLCFAAESIEIHFIGNIVEPACDLFTLTENRCQNMLNQSSLESTALNIDGFQSIDEVSQFIEQYSLTTLASIKLVQFAEHPDMGGLVVKYR